MSVTFDLSGVRELKEKLSRLAREIPKAAESALTLEGEKIMTDSKRNYVPVDLGTLRFSGHVTTARSEGEGGGFEVSLSYGGAAAPYALAVHEHPSEHSPPSWQGSDVTFSPSGHGPKYLEKPFRAAENGMLDRLGERIAGKLKV